MDKSIDLQIVCDKLNEMIEKSPSLTSPLLNFNYVVSHNEAVTTPITCYPMGDALVVNLMSFLSSFGDGSHILVPAISPMGAIGVRLVPVNTQQEETL